MSMHPKHKQKQQTNDSKHPHTEIISDYVGYFQISCGIVHIILRIIGRNCYWLLARFSDLLWFLLWINNSALNDNREQFDAINSRGLLFHWKKHTWLTTKPIRGLKSLASLDFYWLYFARSGFEFIKKLGRKISWLKMLQFWPRFKLDVLCT